MNPDQNGKQIIQETKVPKKDGFTLSKKPLNPLKMDPKTTMFDIP